MVAEGGRVFLPEISVEILRGDDIIRIRRIIPDFAHDCDQHVFFLAERTWVQAVAGAKHCEAPIGQGLVHGLAKGVGEKLYDDLSDEDVRLSHVEELIAERQEDHEANPYNPRTDSGLREQWSQKHSCL